MKFNNIYILTSEPFPHGLAATNRILSYCLGFRKHGVDCKVIIFNRTEKNKLLLNKVLKGRYNGILFQYLSNSTIRSKFFIKRVFHRIGLSFNLLIFALDNFNAQTVIIYYSSDTFPLIIIRFALWLYGGALLKEESEHPDVYLRSKNFFSKYFFKYVHYSLFDGFLLMTKNLVNYFNEYKNDKPVLQVPMTVDFERFNFKIIKKKKFITYVGVLNNKKDGVDILIKAFARISNNFPAFKLALYGDAESEVSLLQYKSLVSELGILNKVIFSGEVSNDKTPKLISESTLLILARPDSVQAKHGFPTKLGEYLASANPVIATAVGEIPDYLKGNIDVFFAKPGDEDSLMLKMIEVLSDLKNAQEVGLRGCETAKKYFNNVIQTKKIIDFIERI